MDKGQNILPISLYWTKRKKFFVFHFLESDWKNTLFRPWNHETPWAPKVWAVDKMRLFCSEACILINFFDFDNFFENDPCMIGACML